MNNFKKPFFMSSFREDDFEDGNEINDNEMWDSGPAPSGPPPRSNWNRGGKSRGYNQAYGDYQGGYGPGGGFGRRNPMFRGGPYGPSGSFFNPPLDDNIGPLGNFNLSLLDLPPQGGGNWMGPPGSKFGPPPLFQRRNDHFDDNYDDGPDPYEDYGDRFYPPGRGYGPDGPPSKNKKVIYRKVLRYLTRCGVPNEYLKNMPIKFCELIEPNHCGLCGHDFESFQLSRIHYISKNHLKKQKKWIQHFQSDNGSLVPEEKVPLKSRDLYCELCDVHITSKAHSDSHYAGRSHRSIVEGRKPPKNPLLLQPNMEARLDSLIRREKRNLKPLEEVEHKQEVEPSKPVSSDLYCNICKTSVTCSEQMTMHLNGKKHLSKEKQHILRMMSGQAATEESTTKKEDEEANATENLEENEAELLEENTTENLEENAAETSAAANEETVNWGQGGGELWEAI